jgi:TonB family protein
MRGVQNSGECRCVGVLMFLLACSSGSAAPMDSTTGKPDAGKQKELPFSAVHDTELGRSLSAALDACTFDSTSRARPPDSPSATPQGIQGTPPHTIGRIPLDYPLEAMRSGNQGTLDLEILIGVDGNARFVHVARLIPYSDKSAFAEAAIDGVRRARFEPARMAGSAIATWKRIRFTFGNPDPKYGIFDEMAVKRLLRRAAAGEPDAIVGVSYLDSGHRLEQLSHELRRDYLVYTAMAGFGPARILLTVILGRADCTPTPPVAEFLRGIAWRGDSTLELMQAMRLLQHGDAADRHDIAVLLHGAANGNDPFVQAWAAGILATAPDAQIRDPAAALAAVHSMKDDGYPEFQELLAASAAANGDFVTAVAAEGVALKRAHGYHWIETQMNERLASYQAHQAWSGYLCDCSTLLPTGLD